MLLQSMTPGTIITRLVEIAMFGVLLGSRKMDSCCALDRRLAPSTGLSLTAYRKLQFEISDKASEIVRFRVCWCFQWAWWATND